MSEDRTSMYKIQEEWLTNIAPKYFDMPDTSLNRLGLFGYINEILSHTNESITNENSIFYNELFFKRAVLPQSIYAYASHYNVQDITATPASMSFALWINEETVLEKSITKGDDTYFIIDNDSEIWVENKIPFMLDYNVKISIKKDKFGNYVYSAKYVTTGFDNPISSVKNSSNPFIKLTTIKSNLTNYIVIYVTCHQCKKVIKNKTIYSQDFIEYFSFNVEANDDDREQIADFSVFYRKPNEKEFSQIDKILIDRAESEKPFCFYEYRDYNVVNITFSTIARFFRPEFNSELNFVFYNTMGANANFKYTGDNVAVALKSSKYDYRDVIILAHAIGDSVGGRNRLSYEEIKAKVSIKASTCDIIATELDLNKYFNSIENCSYVKFVKKRDDILDRLYGAFLLMRDDKNNLIPTNTNDIYVYQDKDFDIIEESTKRYVIKAGKKFVYQPNSRYLIPMDDSLSSKSLVKPKFEYLNPFTIIVNKEPLFIEYYLTSINKSYVPDYAYVNESTYTNFICNKISIFRNNLVNNEYTIQFKIIPNIDSLGPEIKFAEFDDHGNFIKSNGELFTKGIFYNYETGEPDYYFDIEMIDAKMNTKECTFKAVFKTDDYISNYSRLRIIENMVDISKPDRINPLIDATKLKLGIIVSLKYDNFKSTKYHSAIPDLSGYTISNIFNVDDDIDIIHSLQKYMYSSVIYEKDVEGTSYWHIKEVPMMRYDYAMIPEYYMDFIRQFLSDFQVLKDHLKSLTNAFNLSVKFFNTYGKSYYMYINEKKSTLLDKIDLRIKMRITLNPSRLMDEGLKAEITKFIESYIESVNYDINLYISNLIKALENNFQDINHMKFIRINDYGAEVQSIEKNFPTTDYLNGYSKLKDFVPEFINIHKDYDGYNIVTNKVELEFV